AIIFANTKQNANEVANFLQENGIKVGVVHGDIAPRERIRVMKQIHDLEFQYIVATDLAARGIDIPGVSHVINYEIPDDLEFFIHRVGRTARAGLEGHAITLYTPNEEQKVEGIEALGVPFVHEDVKNGEFITLKERHARQKRKHTYDEIDRQAVAFIRKPKKVKPGYKKKLARQIDDYKKRERRKQRKQGRK